MLTNISDVYTEIRSILGEYADDFNIEAIADQAYTFNPDTQAFEASEDTEFWATVEANER